MRYVQRRLQLQAVTVKLQCMRHAAFRKCMMCT